MSSRPTLAFVLCTVVFTGCADRPPTSPGITREAFQPRALIGSGRPTLFSNSVKYRDSGGHPATGRSGSADLTVLALLGASGSASLDVVAGVVDEPPDGLLAKVQVKQFDANDQLQSSKNYRALAGSTAHFAVPTRVHGTKLQVQASITNVDGNRTDIVTVTETVKYRPDIAATGLVHDARVLRGGTTMIVATYRELRGDLGARANCVLTVDGVAVDQAQSIWVDANGDVSCAFMHRFDDTGTRQLSVSAENVSPGDYDAANNSRSSTIEVVDPVPVPETNEFTWSGDVWGNQNIRGTTRADGWWEDAVFQERQDYHSFSEFRGQDNLVIHVGGMSPTPLRGQVGVSYRDWVDATVIHEDMFRPATDSLLHYQPGFLRQDCSFLFRTADFQGERGPFVAQVGMLVACTSNWDGPAPPPAGTVRTWFSYFAQGGTAMYYSEQFSHTVGPDFDRTFSFTGSFDYLWGSYAHGSQYGFEFIFTSGDDRLVASGMIPLTAEDVSDVIPYECVDYDFPEEGFFQHDCYGQDLTYRHFSGVGSGAPPP